MPVRNEERDLVPSVTRLAAYLRENFGPAAVITIADNGSADATPALARELADTYPDLVRVAHLDLPGRGRALHAVWSASDADVVAYMDVDLSTDLAAFAPLIDPLLAGQADVSIGSRLAPGARVVRGLKREIISRAYNRLLRVTLGVGFRDAQCGFKAMRTPVARALLPAVVDNGWFPDRCRRPLSQPGGERPAARPGSAGTRAAMKVRLAAGALRVSRRRVTCPRPAGAVALAALVGVTATITAAPGGVSCPHTSGSVVGSPGRRAIPAPGPVRDRYHRTWHAGTTKDAGDTRGGTRQGKSPV